MDKKLIEELTQIVVRQTNLTYEEAGEKLANNKYNYMYVIKEYIKNDNQPDINISKKTTINQQIYSEIRTLMDNASRNYRRANDLKTNQSISKDASAN